MTGGIVDDTVITRLGPETFYFVTNAACREKDLAYLSTEIQSCKGNGSIDWQVLDGWGLIALQGPLSASVLEDSLVDPKKTGLRSLYFGQCKEASVRLASGEASASILVSRGGYTGEDGFEISVSPRFVVQVAEQLLQTAGSDRLRLAGLGARDSLRLEAGMCLYGHDLDDSTTPVEAGLSWIIHKDRRVSGGFHGDEKVLGQLRPVKEGGTGVPRRRVGLIVDGAPAREGAEIMDPAAVGEENAIIGNVTSGCPSPTIGKNIAMSYVKDGFHKSGTELEVLVRGKARKAVVVKMPFVKSRYWKQTLGTAPG